jgi:hypothetical protein
VSSGKPVLANVSTATWTPTAPSPLQSITASPIWISGTRAIFFYELAAWIRDL